MLKLSARLSQYLSMLITAGLSSLLVPAVPVPDKDYFPSRVLLGCMAWHEAQTAESQI